MAKGKYEKWLEPENLILIEGWARNGLTEEQIAKNMGIAYSTLRDWKEKYPALSAALKKNKEIADIIIENALFERAKGGIHEVKKTIKVKHTYYDSNGRKCEKEELQQGIDEVYTPGDTTAQIFWLKNRKPEVWRDKVAAVEREEYESDGFVEALKADVEKTFMEAGDIVET